MNMDTERTDYPRGSAVAFVYWPDWCSILLVRKKEHKHEGGRWGCPGGKQEFGESSVAAAWREGREETGGDFNSDNLQYRGIVAVAEDHVPEIHKHYLSIIHMFEVRPRRNPHMINAEPGNHSSVEWFPLTAIPPNVTTAFRKVAVAMTQYIGQSLIHPDVVNKPWGFAEQDV
jgi:ADP-ribose pyrophosphatase YjhB (NUDIX family)